MYDELHDSYKLAQSRVTRADYIICWMCFLNSEGRNTDEIKRDKLPSHNTTKHFRCNSTCGDCGCVFRSEGELGTHNRFMHP